MIVDSNLIILASKSSHVEILDWLLEAPLSVSAISRVEVMGYRDMTKEERSILNRLFAEFEVIPITDPILDEAIRLKQQKKMSLGDSIIAGTAILHGGELATRNLKDFQNIPGLCVSDPTRLAGSSETL
jgi:toxin FitB